MDKRMDRRTVAKGAGVVAGAAALGMFPAKAGASAAPQQTPGEPSLYDRLGGYFAIAAVVNRFSDEILRNPILNKNPALKAWKKTQAETRLPGLKFGRTLWIAAAAGGPFVYTGLPLNEAHEEFHLTATQFAEVGKEIVRALDFYGVPEREQQELMAAYRASMSDVVSASEEETAPT
jgi:hemoglobin